VPRGLGFGVDLVRIRFSNGSTRLIDLGLLF
jgi:hypothetical protein